MQLFRKPTMVETIALIVMGAMVAGVIFVPDSATATRRQLERRARDWKREPAPVLSDASLLATDVQLSGTWLNRGRLNYTSFTLSNRMDGRFDFEFSTGGCLGGCELSRVGTMSDGALVLDGAVAEYVPRIYDTIYVIRVDDVEYLLPAASVHRFERELNAGSEYWERYVHSRVDESNEPADARETSAQSVLESTSSPRPPLP